jgi:hypothetical protein
VLGLEGIFSKKLLSLPNSNRASLNSLSGECQCLSLKESNKASFKTNGRKSSQLPPEDARRGSASTRNKLANMGGDGLTEPDQPSNSDTAERLRRMKDPDRIEGKS